MPCQRQSEHWASFAGAESITKPGSPQSSVGLQAVADFIEAKVPEAEREKAGEVLIFICSRLFELTQHTREKTGLKPLELNDVTQAYMTQTVLSLSDSYAYPAPMTFVLKDFKQVQASVFQVTRTPGKMVVYRLCI